MTDHEKPVLPEGLENEIKNTSRAANATKIFFGLPTLSGINTALIINLFGWARNPDIAPIYHFAIEKRHHDHARNSLVAEFLSTDAEWLAMIDEDVCPPTHFLDLIKHGKDIVSAKVHCWINGELMPSVWQLAECEQCKCLKVFMEKGEVHDPSQYYVASGEIMYRWNPDRQDYEPFATRDGLVEGKTCRCRGTGMDPWVFRTYQKPFDVDKPIKVDSVGTAALFINRRVFEKMTAPWFQFYYKKDRSILLTEDHYFCWKAGLFGFDIWADMKMTCSHYKRVDLAGVEYRMFKAFEAGVEYQKKKDEKPEKRVVLPTASDFDMIVRPGQRIGG